MEILETEVRRMAYVGKPKFDASKEFLEYIEDPQNNAYASTLVPVANKLYDEGYDIDEIGNYDVTKVTGALTSICPRIEGTFESRVKVIIVYINWLAERKELLHQARFVSDILENNLHVLWKNISDERGFNKKPRYLSHDEIRRLIKNIELFRERNSEFYTALILCFYEGVYPDNSIASIVDLRTSDISDGGLRLKDSQNNEYYLRISEDLTQRLLDLSNIDVWIGRNRYGDFERPVEGLYDDTVFKLPVSNRKQSSARYTIYARLKDVTTEFLGYPVSPKQLYYSGISNRIKDLLGNEGYDFKESMKFEPNIKVSKIIRSEFKRCGNFLTLQNYKKNIQNDIDIFYKNDGERMYWIRNKSFLIENEQYDELMVGSFCVKGISDDSEPAVIKTLGTKDLAKLEFENYKNTSRQVMNKTKWYITEYWIAEVAYNGNLEKWEETGNYITKGISKE